MNEGLVEPNNAALGVRHALLVYTSPTALFRRVEDTGAYGWALVTVLAAVVMLGYIQVQSGLIDRLIDQRTETTLAELESSRADLVDRIALREVVEDARQMGEFQKTIARLGAVVLAPVGLLASFLLIAAVLYACVALTGRKPEWHTLMSICVYAGFIDLFAHAVQLAMVYTYRTLDVDTSLAVLAPPGEPTFLVAIDPFRIWFWCLIGMGLTVTEQLSRRMAIVTGTILCIVGMGVRIAVEYASAA